MVHRQQSSSGPHTSAGRLDTATATSEKERAGVLFILIGERQAPGELRPHLVPRAPALRGPMLRGSCLPGPVLPALPAMGPPQ